MNDYETITEENYTKLILHDDRIIFTDIDLIFKHTNIFFAQILKDMFIDATFDFSKKYNKVIYSHAFIKTVCDHIIRQDSNYKLCFYSNFLTKDPFRNSLLRKLKSIFGFKIMEDVMDFSEVIERFERFDGEIIPKLKVFFEKDNTPKNFKHIKKYLEKTGLKDIKDHFDQVANKMTLMY